MDEAFCFYYEDNLRMLEKCGAQLLYFSPLHDTCLPEDCDAMLLGGGYRAGGMGELAGRLALAAGQTEGAAYVVGREFARAGQLAAQTSFDRNRSTQQTADHLLHQRLSLFDDQQRTALRSHALYECVGSGYCEIFSTGKGQPSGKFSII